MCDINDSVSDENVEKFIVERLTREIWDELGDSVKTRYRNMTKNYLSFPDAENFMPLPDFLREPVCNPKQQNARPKSVKSKKVISTTNVEATAGSATKTSLRRNPKRKVAEVNYFEEEEPNEDRYVFCDNCEKEYLDFCSTCGMLKSLKDFPVPIGTEDRAKKTAPKSVLEVRPSVIHGYGVFALRDVRKGIQMGPYEGQITRVNTTNGYCWKLRDGRLIDAADETRSNWMRYVNCARHVEEQNVAAFQYKGQLYYRTCKDVVAGEELLVYYGESFAKNLGIDIKKYFQPNREELDCDFFCCQFCKIGLSTREYRDAHQKRCRFRPNKLVPCQGKGFECSHCGCLLTTEQFLKTHEVFCSRNPKRKNNSSAKERNFQCRYCNKKFAQKSYLKRHEIIHDKENARTFTCDKCDFKTIRLSDLWKHRKIHSKIWQFKCKGCEKGFNTKQELDRHYLNRHKHVHHHLITSKIHHCEHCGYETVVSTDLKRHISHKHDKENSKKYKCDKCSYSFILKSNLKKHLFIHSTLRRPHVCTECNKDFIRKRSLDGHILSHHKENIILMKSITSQIHSCPICDYRTVRKFDLVRHFVTHDKKKS